MDAAKTAESTLTTGPSVYRRAALAIVALGVLLSVVASDALHGALVSLIALAEPAFATRPVLGALLFVALSALSATLALVSSSALVPVALSVWGPWTTAALLWAGWTVGGLGAYAIGRGLGAAVQLDAAGAVARTLRRVPADTPLWLLAVLQLALQSELSGLVLGAARIPLSRYLAALVVVEVVFAGLTVAAGTGLVERRADLLIAAVAALAAGVAGALALLHRRLPPP